MSRIEILKSSLEKKEQLFNIKLQEHFDTVKMANGQPLNDKRNGAATLNKWEKQHQALRRIEAEVKKTKTAIEVEMRKINNVEAVSDEIPKEILKLVESGELTQWRKFPNTFFVKGVEKARLFWDLKEKKLYARYFSSIPTREQKEKFVEIAKSIEQAVNNLD